MDQTIFTAHLQGALDNVRYNITKLTERHCDSGDDSAIYVEAVTPLLEQQLAILKLAKECVKL